MSVNPDSIPRYEPPTWDELREPPETPYDSWKLCTHGDACERVYCRFVDGRVYEGWRKDMARQLGCDECEECE